MGLLRALAGVVACCLLLVGCSDDDPVDPPTSPTTDSPTSASSTAAPPVEPKLPSAAKKADEAGARAFIAYYWDLINYAQVTGDVAGLENVSGPSCDGCDGGIKAIRDVYGDGGRVDGGEYTVTIKRLTSVAFSTPDARAFQGKVHVRNEEQTITKGDGSIQRLAPTENDITIYVLWTSSGWRLDVLTVE